MVCTFYPPYHFGGDAVFVEGLAHALHKRGHHVEVVHCADAFLLRGAAPPAPPEHAPDGILVHRLESRFGSLSPLITQQTGFPGPKRSALAKIFDRGFDVVNFHNASLIGGPGVLRMSKSPVTLYTIHDHWLVCPTHILWKNRSKSCDGRQCLRCSIRSGIPPQIWRYTGLIERSVRHVDAFLAPSAFTATQHKERLPDLPIHILPTYCTLDPGDPPAFMATARPRFLYAGRVEASKGIDVLLAQFSTRPGYDLDVAGDGELLPALRAAYAHCDWIRFLGRLTQAELVPILRTATALVLPSASPEVFPLSILEALACGTPVISTAAGGAPEAVVRSGGGLVYRNSGELLQALEALATQPELRKTLSARAREAYASYYNEERYVTVYMQIIEQIRADHDRGTSEDTTGSVRPRRHRPGGQSLRTWQDAVTWMAGR